MKRLNKFLKSFTYNQSELKGSLILIVFLSCVLLIPLIYRKITPFDGEISSQDVEVLDSLVARLTLEKNYINDSISQINPNDLSHEEWMKLGASDFLASSIIKKRIYLSSFSCLDEITSIKGVKHSPCFLYFKHFILPNQCTSSISNSSISFRINSISSEQLEEIGVSWKIANRLLKYRKVLGGFCSFQQLKEVYGLSISDYNKIKRRSTLDISKVKKILVNQGSYYMLRRHPYISKQLASKIINYRKKIGSYKNEKDLKRVYGMTEENFKQLRPYISFEVF